MTLLDLLLRRQPARAERLAVEHTCGRQSLIVSSDLHLGPFTRPAPMMSMEPGSVTGLTLVLICMPGVDERIDVRLQLKLEIIELAQRTQE